MIPPIVHAPGPVGDFDRKELRRQLTQLADMMQRGHHWRDRGDKEMRCVHRQLTAHDIAHHVDGTGSPVGLCPIVPGTRVTRVALLDMDSHKGEVSWPSMAQHALNIAAAAASVGLRAIPFRSSGGKGIHLLFVWAAPQDAFTVRTILDRVIATCGFESGTGGVKHGQIEIYPKQDAVPEGRFGSMFILPYSGKSCALDPETMDAITIAHLDPSDPLTTLVKPEREPVAPSELPEFPRIEDAVHALPEENSYDHKKWHEIACAIHDGTDGSDEGRQLLLWYTDNKHHHDKRAPEEHVDKETWPYIRDEQQDAGESRISVASLFYHARKAGWKDERGATEGFEDVPAEDSTGPDGAVHPAAVQGLVELVKDGPYTEFAGVDDLDILPPEPRAWVIENWFALGVVHMLFSRGGMGKTLLALMLLQAVALGRTWLGLPTKRGKVLGFFCEESENDLRMRLRIIVARENAMDLPTFGGQLLMQGRLGLDNVLVSFNNERKLLVSSFYRRMVATIKAERPSVVVLDNVAQLFGGQENDRAQVTQFVNRLARVAREEDCAIILLGHTAKAGDSGFSGSTAWENVSRVRLLLERDSDDDGASVLSIQKSNIGPRTKLQLQYQEGAFTVVATGTTSTSASGLLAHVLGELQAAQDRGEWLGGHHSSTFYLPTTLSSTERGGGYSVDQLKSATRTLIEMRLVDDQYVYVPDNGHGKEKRGLRLLQPQVSQWLAGKSIAGRDADDLA